MHTFHKIQMDEADNAEPPCLVSCERDKCPDNIEQCEGFKEYQNLEAFKDRWFACPTPTVWCEKYAHPLHRVCPVILNYENLPEPFKKIADEMQHEGKTGDRVQAKPEVCFKCELCIRNGGVCDPV